MPHEMLGFIDAGGTYHRTPFRDAYEHGGVYTFDEVDRSDPVALLAVNPHLANGVATFPDKQVQRHPDCIIIATANTWGTGADAQYSGATKLDAAFLSRFPMRIRWNIDEATELAIVVNDRWTRRVQAARKRAQAAGLKVMIDTRISQAGAALIGTGMSEDEAAQQTYLANVTPEQAAMIEGRTGKAGG
jgi:cobaltochelatase CobS